MLSFRFSSLSIYWIPFLLVIYNAHVLGPVRMVGESRRIRTEAFHFGCFCSICVCFAVWWRGRQEHTGECSRRC